MKKISLLAAFVVASLAATTAHAQTTTADPNVVATPATQQTVQDAKSTYDQQHDQRKAADQSAKDARRELKTERSQTRDLKSQMKQQREQAKQQKEQMKMQNQQAKVAHEQEKAAKAQLKAQKKAEKLAN
ncbi:MAG: hypothetical protein EOO36_04705 [Cytophagaceae bacterium]|nr:MAG: hypothetical protein EOO36_04705 [Cytophagaceae bacterium]